MGLIQLIFRVLANFTPPLLSVKCESQLVWERLSVPARGSMFCSPHFDFPDKIDARLGGGISAASPHCRPVSWNNVFHGVQENSVCIDFLRSLGTESIIIL
jgi:hypothetical protein